MVLVALSFLAGALNTSAIGVNPTSDEVGFYTCSNDVLDSSGYGHDLSNTGVDFIAANINGEDFTVCDFVEVADRLEIDNTNFSCDTMGCTITYWATKDINGPTAWGGTDTGTGYLWENDNDVPTSEFFLLVDGVLLLLLTLPRLVLQFLEV